MRVNDQVIRYITVRVDEDRRRAEKFKAKRARKASKRPQSAMRPAGEAGDFCGKTRAANIGFEVWRVRV